MAVVYAHIFPNGKKYVGITKQNPKKRWGRGRNYTNNPQLQRAFEKYGWDNVEHLILGEYETLEEAGEVEKKIITEENLQDIRFGYNIQSGGEHGNHSEQTIRKLSESRRGSGNPMYGRRGELSPMYGKPGTMRGKHMSEEAKAKISKANSGKNNGMYGRKLSDEERKRLSISHSGSNNKFSRRVICVETGITYASSGEASRMTGCHQGNINRCCNGTLKTTSGYHWRFADEQRNT